MAKKSALPILAGGAAVLILSSKKNKKKDKSKSSRWGVAVSSDCESVRVVDPRLFDQFLFGAYEELISVDSSLTLIQVTDALFGEVAPNCSGFPENPESSSIAELYAVIARAIASFMARDPRTKDSMGTLIDEATRISFTDWYRYWRNYPSSDIPEAPDAQVAFSSDFSQYQIGDRWFGEIIVPFVEESKENERLDSAFEDFYGNFGVQVGQFTVPISELPSEMDSVKDFLSKLKEAIDKAKLKLG